jgi:type VI secretion system protein ImpJ
MTARPVHWHEGMFLLPQHLQAGQRHSTHFAQLGDKWNLHYSWGLRVCELDLDALANNRLVVRALRARLRDGTLIAIPEDGQLPAVDLKAALEGTPSVRVFLAVPVFDLSRANVANDSTDDKARYLVDTQELEDESTGLHPQPVTIRRLNLKLLLSTQDHSGYETVPIAQFKKADRAQALPELDTDYIPPLLACDAWKPLAHDILEGLYDRIGAQLTQQANLVVTRRISLDTQAPGDRLLLEQLRALNEAFALLRIMVFAQGVHPFTAYLELCCLVGRMVIFSKKLGPRTPADLPLYDHDNLGLCFRTIQQYIHDIRDFRPADYQERPFVRAQERMEVGLERDWLENSWQMFVGVVSSLTTQQIVHLLSPAGTDMKIASASQVDEIFNAGRLGLKFVHSSQPPVALPAIPGLVYFQVDPQAQPAVWQDVREKLSLAVRVGGTVRNPSLSGETNELAIRDRTGQNVSLKFTLYVVRKSNN